MAENCPKVALLKVTNADSTVALCLLDNILIPFFAALSDSSWWVDHPLLRLESMEGAWRHAALSGLLRLV